MVDKRGQVSRFDSTRCSLLLTTAPDSSRHGISGLLCSVRFSRTAAEARVCRAGGDCTTDVILVGRFHHIRMRGNTTSLAIGGAQTHTPHTRDGYLIHIERGEQQSAPGEKQASVLCVCCVFCLTGIDSRGLVLFLESLDFDLRLLDIAQEVLLGQAIGWRGSAFRACTGHVGSQSGSLNTRLREIEGPTRARAFLEFHGSRGFSTSRTGFRRRRAR